MSLLCLTESCDGLIDVGWHNDGDVVECPDCGREHRVWGDETYNDETDECFDWFALTDPDGENPW